MKEKMCSDASLEVVTAIKIQVVVLHYVLPSFRVKCPLKM
jgi:hypothetical protein